MMFAKVAALRPSLSGQSTFQTESCPFPGRRRTISSHVMTFSWVKPALSNEDEVPCSRTQHCASNEFGTRDLAILRVWHSTN